MDSLQELISQIRAAWPPQRFQGVGVVVGLSGGADSTALLIALAELAQSSDPCSCQEPAVALPHQSQGCLQPQGFLIAAHFNHGLRGDESDADEQFSNDLAQRLNLPFVSQRAKSLCQDEATMSAQRMQFLVDTAKQHGARYIALAHSLDDNVETVLHHLMRGTGPAGLCGIGSPRNIDADLVLVRPMLSISRESIRSALRRCGQPWREDSSNDSIHYSRNWIRHELLPLIESRYPAAVAAIDRAIQGQRTWRDSIDGLAEDWLEQHQIEMSPTTFRISPETDIAILIAAMQMHWDRSGWARGAMSRDHWGRLAEVFQGSEATRFQLPGGVEVSCDENQVILVGVQASAD
jgi:tRNA(Ile)-lysidine synthase